MAVTAMRTLLSALAISLCVIGSANAQSRNQQEDQNGRVAYAPVIYGAAVVGGAAARHGPAVTNYVANGGVNRAYDGAKRAGRRLQQSWNEPQGVYQTTPAYIRNGNTYDRNGRRMNRRR